MKYIKYHMIQKIKYYHNKITKPYKKIQNIKYHMIQKIKYYQNKITYYKKI